MMAVVMGWLARSRSRPRPDSKSRTLAHPPSTLIIGVVCGGFFAAIAILSNVYANATTTIYTTATFVAFSLMGLPLIADYFFARHEITGDGMNFGRMTGRRGSFKWADVKRVNFATGMKWFRIETTRGTVVRISAMLRGLPAFARALLENIPEDAIEAHSLEVLRKTAEGKTPSLWA